MESKYRVTRLSPPDRQAIHFYYDVCPESPSGENLVSFVFRNGAPGAGQVVVCATDGSNARPVSKPCEADVHSAIRQQWIDDDTIAYCPGGEGAMKTVLVALKSGIRHEMKGAIRQYSPANGLGLTNAHDFRPLEDNLEDAVCLMDFARGQTLPLFALREALQLHPLGDRFPGVENVRFMHTKWSRDGLRFLVLASTGLTVKTPDIECIHSIYVADADGSNLRYVCEEFHHCDWGADSNQICFFSRNADGSQDFNMFFLDGSPPRTIQRRIRGKHVTVNRDCSKILADITNYPEMGQSAVWIYDATTGQHDELATFESPDFSQRGVHIHPVLSRDEKRVYFNAAPGGFRSLFAVEGF